MKRISLIGALVLCQAVALFAQSADAIVEASRNRVQSKTVSTRSQMVITAKDGSTTERLVDQYSSDTDEGTKMVIIFQKPASVAGTRFLTIENAGRSDDRWIFLPALGKVRRVSASEGSGSFMGTDLSYDDVSSADRDASLDTHSILKEESLDGSPCWVIQSMPKDTSYQYSKMVSWIGKADSVMRKVELYDKKGSLLKVMEMGKIKSLQGRLTPMVTTMTNVQAGTSTAVNIQILKYDDPIPASVFTVRFLETGRP